MRAAATMSGTAAASGFVLLLLSVPVVQCENVWDVRYTSTEICVPRGSTVDINCTYTSTFNNRDVTVQKTFWFIKDSNGIYVDLMTDPEYSGRVEYLCENNKCTLRISDLRETDSAVYKFRFTTNQESFTGSAGVTLSVTDLHVQVNRPVEGYYYNNAKLKCQSSCRLPDHLTYVWYKNQQKKIEGASYSDWFDSADTVSCAVKGLEDFHSPSMLVRSQRGWNVRYTSTEICVPRGSTVDINCSYTYPSRLYNHEVTVQKTLWFEENQVNVDLKTQSQYSGRVEYLCGNNKCTLRISDLRETDSAVYKFRFTTIQDSFTGSAGVTLSVTDPQLQVHVRRSTANPYPTWTELTCHSSCQLPDPLSYVWFKNNKRLVGRKKYFLLQHFNAGDNYHCAIEGHERFPSPTLNAPKVPSVSVSPSGEIMEGSSVTLTCSSDANPAAKYTWYKRRGDKTPQLLSEVTQFVLSSIRSSDSREVYCTAENELGRSSANILIDVKYAPKVPSVSVSPSGEIMEGSSVTLTCSSDANPAANYTWYKENQTLLQGPEGVYRLSSISSGDSGVYSCKSENQYGQINSTSLHLDVQYAPKVPSVSVSPSGEIMEGSSVTLTCSSDANPAAKYTWYKRRGDKTPQLLSEETQFVLSSIRSSDSGEFYCTAENELGRSSANILIDVKYAPKVPSVSVSPSGEMVEGSSVTLTCSSDANPAANYTWYKEDEDSPRASGQNFTITNITAEHGGNYRCEAQNRRGLSDASLHVTVEAVWTSAVIGSAAAAFLAAAFLAVTLLAVTLLSVFFLIRKKRNSHQSPDPGDRLDHSEQRLPNQSEEDCDLHYTSVHFMKTETDPVYSNVGSAEPSKHKEREEVVYASVNFNRSAPRTRGQDTAEDPDAFYSTVKKPSAV
ncbi:Fc receptor-like protein 2 isoform X2 [Paralichthys olivaceus]|uniref:Fc receptor-like protein 2 isoform X2 n=1 Tax=Paralichthys olivaceus TaxID=8255 RepID=UPI00375194EF